MALAHALRGTGHEDAYRLLLLEELADAVAYLDERLGAEGSWTFAQSQCDALSAQRDALTEPDVNPLARMAASPGRRALAAMTIAEAVGCAHGWDGLWAILRWESRGADGPPLGAWFDGALSGVSDRPQSEWGDREWEVLCGWVEDLPGGAAALCDSVAAARFDAAALSGRYGDAIAAIARRERAQREQWEADRAARAPIGARVSAGAGEDADTGTVLEHRPDGYWVAWDSCQRTLLPY